MCLGNDLCSLYEPFRRSHQLGQWYQLIVIWSLDQKWITEVYLRSRGQRYSRRSKNRVIMHIDCVESYHCVTPCDGNTHLFPKEQTQGGASTQRESTQGRSTIKQVPSKHQNDLLPRQWNNKSWRQAQTLKEREVWRSTEGGAQSENCQAPMTADWHQTVENAADQRLTVEMCTQAMTTCPKAVELHPQHTTAWSIGRQSRPQYATAWLTRGKSHPQ
jgi:hypothetical protein